MINSDKYKKNKFRKLVPTSTADTDKLQQLTTVEHDREPSRPLLTISQDMKKSTSKIGVQGVSERYKEKHFVFERRLKTISSMNQHKEEEGIKLSNSSVGQYKVEKERAARKTQLQGLVSIIEQFKMKAERISKAESLEQLALPNHSQQEQQQQSARVGQLTKKTRLASTRLMHIYLQRILRQIKKYILPFIVQASSRQRQLEEGVSTEQANVVLQIGEDDANPRSNNCRRNLLNVSKFFKST